MPRRPIIRAASCNRSVGFPLIVGVFSLHRYSSTSRIVQLVKCRVSFKMALKPLTPAQVRAARAMLDWSMVDLSRAAQVSVSTVKRVQQGGTDPGLEEAFAAIQDALETEGVRFLQDDGNGVGVRLREK